MIKKLYTGISPVPRTFLGKYLLNEWDVREVDCLSRGHRDGFLTPWHALEQLSDALGCFGKCRWCVGPRECQEACIRVLSGMGQWAWGRAEDVESPSSSKVLPRIFLIQRMVHCYLGTYAGCGTRLHTHTQPASWWSLPLESFRAPSL